MKSIKQLTTALGLAACLGMATLAQATMLAPVGVPDDVLADYRQLVGDRDPLTITDFSGPGSRRDVVEVILLQQAIAASGADIRVQLVTANFPESLEQVKRGELVALANSVWRNELTASWDELYITTALISRGEFEAGFYTSPSNRNALAATNLDAVKQLSGVSSRSWTVDWDTLTGIDFARPVRHADSWGEMVELVSSGQVDFLLAPFQPTDGMVLDLGNNQRLVPIPNVKIGLAGSRHMAVSRRHADGNLFNAALHLGLLRLKREGIVLKAYQDSGFINRNASDWALMQAESSLIGY